MNYEELHPRRFMNVVFTLLSEQIGELNRDTILRDLEERLATPVVPDRETWGTSPAFVERQRSIMSQYGPPPGWAERAEKGD